MANKQNTIEIMLCDARVDPPLLRIHQLTIPETLKPTVGWALQTLGIANDADDPVISRKGCFGVFGKRKEWNSPIYAGDRLELYGPLLIDPKLARRKKANRDKDDQLKAKAKQRQEERKARARNPNT
jgi:putative ubiquitin-RnfH superfamily antitoxin RatB of RatAB toxin-antitoxin module